MSRAAIEEVEAGSPTGLPSHIATTVGAAIMSGLFFAFSNFVMRALSELHPASGMETMQRIGVTIINPLFPVVFMGNAIGSLMVPVIVVADRGSAGGAWLIGGALFYLLGVVGVTTAFNVPLNNVLAITRIGSAAQAWPT